ncbi:MAG: hypothetical protein AB1726_01475 [Planctomycetota bacterium]
MDTPHPPLIQLVVRVGVTGHRDLTRADRECLRGRVRTVLESARAGAEAVLARPDRGGYADLPPVLRVLSPLAEGADRLVAQEALDLGFELHCPLPFPREEYEKDFASRQSREEFRTLLSRAGRVLELDGRRDSEKEAYEMVGRTVLDHCDLLVAIWDGSEMRPRGGTGDILEEALRASVPCVHISAAPPHEARYYVDGPSGEVNTTGLEAVASTMAELLAPPPLGSEVDLRAIYFAEPAWEGWTSRFSGRLWSLFLRSLAPGAASGPPLSDLSDPVAGVREPYAKHFEWADMLSQRYAALFRSSYLANMGFKAMTVTCGLAVALAPDWPAWITGWLYLQLACVLAVVGNTQLGRWRHWHAKSIDYRLLAEQLRQVRDLAPMARVFAFSRPPVHQVAGDPRGSWMNWHSRAVIRAVGLPSVRFDASYVAACRTLLAEFGIGQQVRYHEASAGRASRIHERLHKASFWLLMVTVAAWACYFFLGRTSDAVVYRVARMLSVMLPSWVTVLVAIAGFGEFGRVGKRSLAMARHLLGLRDRLDGLPPGVGLEPVAAIAQTYARWMIEETTDWRMVFQAHPMRVSSTLVYSLPR